jgi:putative membrane protein
MDYYSSLYNHPMKIFFRIIVSAISIVITSYLLSGVHVKDLLTALIVAVVLAILNGLVKPILIILTIPVTIITLGLFLFVINALMIIIAGNLVPGFKVDGFWWALLFSIILSLITSLLGIGLRDSEKEVK